MSRAGELHERWSRDPDYRKAYEELGPEFELARSLMVAQVGAGLTRPQLAERLKTTQSVVARLESVRAHPS